MLSRSLIALIFLSAVYLRSAEPLQIDVRVVRGGIEPGELTAGDFVVRENGREQSVLDVRYVPPVGAWSDRPGGAEPTWIYVLNGVGSPPLQELVLPGIDRFLKRELPPKVSLSVFGTPFDRSRKNLRNRVRRIRAVLRAPFGPAPGLPGGTDFAQLNAFWPNRYAMFGLRDAGEKLAARPGRKILIALLPDGGIPPAEGLLHALSADAARNRLSIHFGVVVNAPPSGRERKGALHYIAGLTGGSFHWLQQHVSAQFEIGPSSINVEPTQPLADIGMGMPPSGSGRRPDGICSGCGVVASLLRQVVRSAGDYYLIRYEPGSQGDDDGFRRIEVAAPGRDIELSGPSGYFEPRSAKTPDPGFTPYYQALKRHPKPGLVQVAQLFYPSLSGGVSVFSNIGVHASQVEAAERDGKAVVRFVALTKATGLEAERLPQYRSLVFEKEFTSTEWARLHADPRAFLHGHSQLPLAPGRYRWEVVWQDLNSGKSGAFSRDLTVPDRSSTSGASELYVALRYPAQPGAYLRLVAAEPNRTNGSAPDAVYRRGETLLAHYQLRQATRGDVSAASEASLQIFRQGENEPLHVIPFGVTSHTKSRILRFDIDFSTESLEPGGYRLAATLPGGRAGPEAVITLVDR